MKDENRIWNLMARKLAGEASEEEIKEFQDLVHNNPGISYSMETLSDLWKVKVIDHAIEATLINPVKNLITE